MAFCRPLRSVEGCRVLKRAVGSWDFGSRLQGDESTTDIQLPFHVSLVLLLDNIVHYPEYPKLKNQGVFLILNSAGSRLSPCEHPLAKTLYRKITC